MQKKLKLTNLMPLCLAAAAAVAIIIACGNGEIINTDGDKIELSRENLGNLINAMSSPSGGGSSPSGGDSSPSGGDSSPSGGDSSPSGGDSSPSGGDSSPSGGDSSNSGGDSSSNSGGNSSNSGGNSSASAAPPAGTACPAGSATVTDAACTWTPPSVVAGEPTHVSTLPAECESKAFATVSGAVGQSFAAYFEKGVDITTSGDVSATGTTKKWTWPAESNDPGIKAIITCGDACSVVSCPLVISKAPNAQKSGKLIFTDGQPGTGVTGVVYFVGNTPEYSGLTLGTDDNTVKYCGTIEYTFEGWAGTGQLAAVNSETTIKVTAQCNKSKEKLDSATAKIVPNPKLDGDCEWDTKNDTFGGGLMARVKREPTITQRYGRTCSDGNKPFFTVGGTKKTLVSAGLRVDDYDHAGQKMENIAISASCGSYEVEPIGCNDITVKDPTQTCEYQTNWCKGVALSQILTSDYNNPDGSTMRGKCVFATSVTDLRGAEYIGGLSGTDSTIINGVSVGDKGPAKDGGYEMQLCGIDWGRPACTTYLTSKGIEIADGGYYIYLAKGDKGAWTNNGFKTSNSYKPNLHPNCAQ